MTTILKRNKVKELFNDNGKQITAQALDTLDVLVHKRIINIVRRSKLMDSPKSSHNTRVTDTDIILLFDDEVDSSII